ncbi:MAG: M28 family metallopeptidase [Steroidobacteraceae bacterium]
MLFAPHSSCPPLQRAWSVLICLLAPLAANAQQASPTVQTPALQAHVTFLADDLLDGRAAASRGYEIASKYVASQLQQYGLKPAGDEGTWFQQVPLLEATPVLPGSSATLTRDNETIEFEYSTDYLPGADFLSSSSNVTAPLAFAGFGIEAPEQQYNDFEHVDVTGRIAVIFSGAPARFPATARAYHSWSLRKWSKLVEHGAVGVIVVDSPDDAKRVPWERAVALSWVPQMRWLDDSGTAVDSFPELKLRFRFNPAAAPRLFDGAEHGYEEILKALDDGVAQGFALPGTMTLSATTGLRRTNSVNVVGLLEGADAKLKSEFVVVTAHLDHLGKGAAVDGDAIYNGAHDNALGVGMLLEIARTVTAGVRPRRSILFVGITAEERGLLGSDYFVAHSGTPPRTLIANINIDTPMTFAATRDLIAFGESNSSLGPLTASIATALGYRLSPDPNPEEVALVRNDQFSFVRRGIPAIALQAGNQSKDSKIDMGALKQEYRQRHYHQPSDDLSLPMDFDAAADIARINRRLVVEVANAPTRPRWRSGDFFGQTFGKN